MPPAKEDGMEGLWRHQVEAIEWARERRSILLHHEMGCGKTRTAIEILKELLASQEAGKPFRVLVCCPKAVIAAWLKQASLWWPEARVCALTKGTAKAKSKQVAAALADLSPLLIVVNYETAWRAELLEKTSWSAIVWDEVHRLKSPSGAASRWAARVCKKNPTAKRVGLSGTMVPQVPLDIYGIYRSVEAPECQTFGQSYTLFKANHAICPPGQHFVVAWKNLEQLHQKIAATTHRVKSADVLDLPPIRFFDVPCDLSSQEARVYKEIEREFCAVVEEGTVTPANALVQLLRMQQICGGSVTFDGDQTARQIVEHPAKAEVLADMLEDSPADEPWVIFCRFKSDIAAARKVCETLSRKYGELSGARNDLAAWQQAETTVLITQIQSGGIGVDLTRSRYCCFYSLGYSLSDYLQAVARLHRPGQSHETSIWHLVATIDGRSTVDGRVYQALRERREVVDVIVDGYAAGIASGAR